MGIGGGSIPDDEGRDVRMGHLCAVSLCLSVTCVLSLADREPAINRCGIQRRPDSFLAKLGYIVI